jgi:hypothetical protein
MLGGLVMALDIPECIRAKITAGLLPVARDGTIRVWAGIGTGRRCNACDRPISVVEFECEMKGPDGQPLLFHKPCFDTWKLVRVPR